MSLGAIMFHIMLFSNVSAPIKQLHRIYDEVNDALIYSEGFFDIIESKHEVEISGNYKPEKITGLFELKNVKHETFKIQSKQVGEERVINVWTPENYKASKDSLPVMYMADGGIKEDFPHIANTLAKLIKEKKIKPLILVGIENTQRRRDLTGFTEVAKDKEIAPVVGGSEKFRAFIKDELFPEINKRYRTTTEKSIIGESASGLFVMETFFLDT
jgi:enterochelin esterase-like enzyme